MASPGSNQERCASTRRISSGPTSAPAPRTANSRPVPSGPAPNITASTGKRVSTPLPSPTADFTVTRASTRGRCPMYPSASPSAAKVRCAGCAPSRAACIGRRIRVTSNAAPTRLIAATAKQVYGSKAALSTPPRDAPTTAMVPQADPATAFAAERSAGSTRLGSAADAAGE